MKSNTFFFVLALLAISGGYANAADPKPLRVNASGRCFETTDGTPFFWLGDTAWELFHRTTREEADRYLIDRAAKGFTVIQAVALAEEDGLNTANSYGHRAIIHAMAKGIKRGDGGRNLMTFHPSDRRNSADDFHDADWLDFNMTQSGHERPATPNFELMLKNLSLQPRKPTLDGEPCYEDHPIKGETWNRCNDPGALLDWYDEWNIRVAAYGSMLAGACGHTYGDHNIWQMWLPVRPAKSIARTPWPEALHHPGSRQMKFFRDVFESRPFGKLRSDQSLVTGDNPVGEFQVRSALAADRAYALICFPKGQLMDISLDRLSGSAVKAWRFNPRQNASQLIGEFSKAKTREFQPMTSGRNNDWLLVLDDAETEMPRLGFSYQNLIPLVKE